MMPKITDVDINFVERTNKNIGIIFPGGAGGNFLYTFYTNSPATTFANNLDYTDENKLKGSYHIQDRDLFDVPPADENHDEHLLRVKFEKDFIAHYYNQQLVRLRYPNHFLISIAPDPNMYLFIIYMLVQKTFRWRDDFSTLDLEQKLIELCGMLYYIKKYNYTAEFCDLLYTTKEILYDKTNNSRLIKYRHYNKQHHDVYINYFENMLSQVNHAGDRLKNIKNTLLADLEMQLLREKDFLKENKKNLYI